MHPSGEQFVIRHGGQEAIAVEVGGGLRTYTVDGHDVLDGYSADAMCDAARGQTLVPWPNRVKDGQWSWQGSDQQLVLSEPEQHNAIHGLVRWLSWGVVERADSSITLRCESMPQPGYPWRLAVTNTWSLSDSGLTARTSVRNDSDTAAPVAVGFHPYVTVGTPTIDEALLTIPGATRIMTGEQQIPTGREPVDGTPYDFREPRPLGDVEIDYAFADLDRDEDGLARLVMAAPDGGRTVTVWVDAAYPYLEVFTGDALPDLTRRRRGLGVEPMSAPPNAMATGESLVAVAPGEQWAGSWGITWSSTG